MKGDRAMDINQIMKFLPHRYPFLLCDRIISHEYNISVVGIKNVSMNEPFFQGHFPDEPIMPGVLILEAMAQIGGFMFLDENNQGEGSLKALIAGFDRVKFTHKVIPGDKLVVEGTFISMLGTLAKINAVATVDGVKAASAEITYKF